ncbi:MAG: class I SAM-dependent methyltransferase [Elusimicrobiota bacterium]
MKIRESGMPDQNMWVSFFDPGKVLATLGMNTHIGDVAEFGCGYGTFTIPAAKIIKGNIYALDIEPEMIQATNEEAAMQNLDNVKAMTRDFMAQGSGLPDQTVDYVMLFNILHLENPDVLLNEAWRVLKNSGKLGIIHWRYDLTTPRGPSMEIRPKPEDCIRWAAAAGFGDPQQYDLKPYHYGITMSKEVSK